MVLVLPALPTALAQDLPVAFSGKIVGDDNTTRVMMDFDRNLRVKTFYMDEPHRIIIDLEETTFNFGADSQPESRGLVADVRFGRISKGRSRIVLTLARPAEIVKASLQQRIDADHYRFILDIDATSAEKFASLLDSQSVDLGESGGVAVKGDRVRPPQPNKSDAQFTVVIDPGHGGIDGGAVGKGGTNEKDVVLAVALRLAENIRKLGPYEVLLSREDDVFMSLSQRVDFARRANADLLISIHADSLRQRFVRGATVYTLSKKASDRLAAALAESENAADLAGGLAVSSDAEAVADILVDLTTRETKKFSKMFSRLLVMQLDEEIKLIKNPQRSASFGVLKAPDVPGVLLELGYLSNPEDEKLLKQPKWQATVAESVARAVDGFFKFRKLN